MSKKIKIWVLAGFVVLVLFFVKQFFNQKFDSVESLQNYMKGFGIAAPLMLTLFQAVQVVIPVLPGYLGCAAGAIAFGSMTGFWCNYIGISLGSIIAYFLAQKYGIDIVTAMFPRRQYEKWSRRIEKSKSYERFLFIATLLPLFPDDFLCYFSYSNENGQQKIYMDYYSGKAMVYSGVQYRVWINKIKEKITRMKKKLLGYYDYTVILTYCGMLFAFFGLLQVLGQDYWNSALCLMLAGIELSVASTKDRNESEKRFGIQIDSLSDLISFGVLPAVFVYMISGKNAFVGVTAALFVLCALIRLAYFNILYNRKQEKLFRRSGNCHCSVFAGSLPAV